MRRKRFSATISILVGSVLFILLLTSTVQATDLLVKQTEGLTTQHTNGFESKEISIIEATAIARAYLDKEAQRLGLTLEDVNRLELRNTYRSNHNGLTHLYFRQTYQGLPILNSTLSVHIDRNGQVIKESARLVGSSSALAKEGSHLADEIAPIGAATALQTAALALTGRPLDEVQEMGESRFEALPAEIESRTDESTSTDLLRSTRFQAATLSSEPIPMSLAYYYSQDPESNIAGKLHLVWEMVIHATEGPHVWNAMVDAHTNQLVQSYNWNISEDWGAHNHTHFVLEPINRSAVRRGRLKPGDGSHSIRSRARTMVQPIAPYRSRLYIPTKGTLHSWLIRLIRPPLRLVGMTRTAQPGPTIPIRAATMFLCRKMRTTTMKEGFE